MRCSFEIFLSGKVAAIDVYCWLHKTVIFCVEEIILGIETTRYVSTLRSYMWLKCLILNVSFSLVLFSPQIFSRYIDMCMKDTDLLIENNVQPILVFQKLEHKQMRNPPSLTCCWGQQQVSGGFLFILVRMNSVIFVRCFLYDLLGIVKNLAQKV